MRPPRDDEGEGGAHHTSGKLKFIKSGGGVDVAMTGECVVAIGVAAEMRAGGAFAHSIVAIEEMEKAASRQR